VSESPASPIPYRVSYSEVVRQKLSAFADEALERGLGQEYLAGLKEFDRRLRIYPQFGDPLSDLNLKPAQLCIGVVWPVVLRYSLDEERRLVLVVASFLLLPKSAS
jgi:hypothetical protein